MAPLPDPTHQLHGDDLAAFEHMASVRAHAEGRSALGEVYVRMFNNPGVAAAVGGLGEHLRFRAILPDDVRELVILRSAACRRVGYEWAHHQRPALMAGIGQEVIDSLIAGGMPESLPPSQHAALAAVDVVVAGERLPEDLQSRLADAFGLDGVVELVVLCGFYGLLGSFVRAFDVALEEGLPDPGF